MALAPLSGSKHFLETPRLPHHLPQQYIVKNAILKQALKIPSIILKPIGIALTAGGGSLMISSTFPTKLVGLVITFIGLSSLYAENEQSWLENQLHEIRNTEQNGDYAKALQMARSACAQTMQKGLVDQSKKFAAEIACLENAHLKYGSSHLLFDQKFQPRKRLLVLLAYAGIDNANSKMSIGKINEWAQKNLLRSGERWEAQSTKFEAIKQNIFPILQSLGFVNEASPNFKEYQGAIVHGALLPRVRLRLQYLADQWKQGVRFSDLYFLSGERPLEPQHENKNTFENDGGASFRIRKGWAMPAETPKTECEMARLVWEQADIPEDMRKQVHVHFVNAPMKKDPKTDKPLRPTTDDTVVYWLKLNPTHGRYLAVSNAPYTNRQDLVVRAIAPKEFGFDTVGSEASKQEKMAIFLDELARLIFQVNQQADKSK